MLTLINIYQTTRHHFPEDNNIYSDRRENLKSHFYLSFFFPAIFAFLSAFLSYATDARTFYRHWLVNVITFLTEYREVPVLRHFLCFPGLPPNLLPSNHLSVRFCRKPWTHPAERRVEKRWKSNSVCECPSTTIFVFSFTAALFFLVLFLYFIIPRKKNIAQKLE
jgi:hypothetical protein